MIRIARTVYFNAARTLWRPGWSREKNRAVYGEESPHGYGHNYRLDVEVEGSLDPERGLVINLTDLDRILKEEVDRPLDHRHLNLDVPAFESIPPTAENLALWIASQVEARIAREGWDCRLARLRLTVTPEFSVEIEP